MRVLVMLVLAAVPAMASDWAALSQPGPFIPGVRTFAIPAANGEPDILTEVWYPVQPTDVPGQLASSAVTGRPMRWRYPSGIQSEAVVDAPMAPGHWPLLVFSHSFSALRTQSTFLTEHLASHGFVVAAPDHRFSSAWDFQPLQFGKSLLTRPVEVKHVLDALLRSSAMPNTFFAGKLDSQRVGVMGHSLGGLTALAVAGAPLKVHGRDEKVNLGDDRVKVVVALAPLVKPVFDDEALARIWQPTLLAVGTRDVVVPVTTHTRLAFEQLWGPRMLAELDGGSHFNFNNREMLDGAPMFIRAFDNPLSDRDESDSLVQGLVLAFLDYHLRNYDRYGDLLAHPPTGMTLESRGPDLPAEGTEGCVAPEPLDRDGE